MCIPTVHRAAAVCQRKEGALVLMRAGSFLAPRVIHSSAAAPQVDIRQWVLVSDINPMTMWMFDSAYVRWCGVDYSLENVGDRRVHLPACPWEAMDEGVHVLHAGLRTCATTRCSSWRRGTRGVQTRPLAAAAAGTAARLPRASCPRRRSCGDT